MNKLNKQIKERPIILSADEVRAVLDGRKTQHRILVKKNDDTAVLFDPKYYDWRYDGLERNQHCMEELTDITTHENPFTENYVSIGCCPFGSVGEFLRVNDKLKLVITDLSIERVQSIKAVDAKKTGITEASNLIDAIVADIDKPVTNDPVFAFEQDWVAKHGQESWDSNVWVWVIDFEVVGGVQ